MKTKLTFLFSLAFLFLFSDFVCGQEIVKKKYHDNGKLKRETHFEHGNRNGRDTWFYKTGEKMFEVHVKNGKAEGLRTEWYENGNKKKEGHYKDGNLDRNRRMTEWYENGNKKKETHYKDRKNFGVCTECYEN